MKKFIYLSKTWIDYIIKEIPSNTLKKITETLGVQPEGLHRYEVKAGIIEMFLRNGKKAGPMGLAMDYLADTLPLKYTVFYDYQSSVAYFGGNAKGRAALIGSANGFLNEVEKIEDQYAAGGFYGMVQFNLMADNPDDKVVDSFRQGDTDLYARSMCQAIEKLSPNETNFQFLAKKLYVKGEGSEMIVIGLPIFVALTEEE